MAVKKMGRPPVKASERKVEVKTTAQYKHRAKAKKAIDKIVKDIPLMIAYADGNAIIVENANL